MRCRKCGNYLDENAVFCDKCGAFVMHSEYDMLPNNGFRIRRKKFNTSFWLKITATLLIAAIIGVCIGYSIIIRDLKRREAAKYATPPKQAFEWDKSLTNILMNRENDSAY